MYLRKKRSLRRANLIGIVGSAIGSLVLMGILAVLFMQSFVAYSVEESNASTINLLIPSVRHYFEHPENLVKSIQEQYERGIRIGRTPRLQGIVYETSYEYIRRVELIDKDKKIVDVFPFYQDLIGMDTSGRKYYDRSQAASYSKTATFADVVTGKPTLAYVVKNSDDSELIVYPNLSVIQNFLEGIMISEHSMIGIVDPNGVYVAHNFRSKSDERFVEPLYHKWIENKNLKLEDQYINGYRYIVRIAAVDADGWALVIYQSYSDMVQNWMRFVLTFTLAFIIIVVLVGIFAGRTYIHIANDIDGLIDGIAWIGKNSVEQPDIPFRYVETGDIIDKMVGTRHLIRQREDEILELNRNLETRVRERTMDLEAMNEELISTIENLEDTQDRLVEARKMAELGQIIAGVAHEMNTPLGNAMTISSFLDKNINEKSSDLLNGKMTRKQVESWINDISESIRIQKTALHKSATLVQEFKRLDVNRSGQADWFDFQVLVDDLARDYATEMIKHKVVIKSDIYQKRIFCDPNVLKEVLSVLVDNVIKHAYPQDFVKRIEIQGKVRKNEYIITLQDFGVGMEQGMCEQVFSAFKTMENRGDSSGLGLFIAGSYVRNLLHGEISCKSQSGKGTRMIIQLKYPVEIV